MLLQRLVNGWAWPSVMAMCTEGWTSWQYTQEIQLQYWGYLWGHVMVNSWRRVIPYLGMLGRFCGNDPGFGDFQSDLVPILYLNTIWLTPLSTEKNCLSLSHLSHLVPEILWSKIGQIFHQIYLLTDFRHFVSIFFFIFIDLRPFWSPYFRKTWDLIGPNCFLHAKPSYYNFGEVPSPPWR